MAKLLENHMQEMREKQISLFTFLYILIFCILSYGPKPSNSEYAGNQPLSCKKIILLYHHLILRSLILSMCSFCHFRYHRIGLIVLFLHDLNDVFLEFSKLCVAFKTRNGKYCRISDILSAVGFVFFVSSW